MDALKVEIEITDDLHETPIRMSAQLDKMSGAIRAILEKIMVKDKWRSGNPIIQAMLGAAAQLEAASGMLLPNPQMIGQSPPMGAVGAGSKFPGGRA